MSLDPQQKLLKAEEYKAEGNERFKEKLYKKALVSYAKGIAYVKNLPGSSRNIPDGMGQLAAMRPTTVALDTDVDQKSLQLEVILHSNIAICHIKLGTFHRNIPRYCCILFLLYDSLNRPPWSFIGDGAKCVEAATKALVLNPTALKALLRKCEGYILLNNCEKANEFLEEAKKHADESAQIPINDLRKRIIKMEKDQVLKQKEMFSKIFL